MLRKWNFAILIGIALLGILLGSFYDLSLAQALYHERNGFGVFVASLGELPAYGGAGFLAGALLFLSIHRYPKWWQRALLYVSAALLYGLGTYFQTLTFLSVNAYNMPGHWEIGLPICGGLVLLFGVGGFFFAKHSDQQHLLRVIITMAAVVIVSALLFEGIKRISPRPRYRWLIGETSLTYESSLGYFTPWWQNVKALRDAVLLKDPGLKEEFKSFPSGHTSNAMACVMMLSYLPVWKSSLKKWQNLFCYIGFAYGVLVAFTRMLIGAHFLSDVSWGAALSLLCFYLGDFVLTQWGKHEKTA